MITLVPFILIMRLSACLFIFPNQVNDVISLVRLFFGETLGPYYLIINIGTLIVSIFLSFSKYGSIVHGELSDCFSIAQRKHSGSSSEKYAFGYEQLYQFNETEAFGNPEAEVPSMKEVHHK